MKKNLFSIVVPLYNEKGNILPLLKEFYLFKDKYHFELILVNDGSNDGTNKVLLELDKKYLLFSTIINCKKNQGYGGAILKGLKLARGNTLGWIHSDLQTDIKYIFEGYSLFIKTGGKKVIKGNRMNRKIGQVFFSNTMGVICSVVFGYKLFEINAQPKIFSIELYTKFTNPPKDFSLDLYLLVLAKRNGFLFKNIDVNFIDRTYGYSKWKTSIKLIIKTIFRSLMYIFILRFNK